MKYLLASVLATIVFACSSPCTLQMDPSVDLSGLNSESRCWLANFESMCISIAKNKDFADSQQLKADIGDGLKLLSELADTDSNMWYTSMSDEQQSRFHKLILAIAIHYGVKHFLNL